jgi:hypothetical protein
LFILTGPVARFPSAGITRIRYRVYSQPVVLTLSPDGERAGGTLPFVPWAPLAGYHGDEGKENHGISARHAGFFSVNGGGVV